MRKMGYKYYFLKNDNYFQKISGGLWGSVVE